MPNMIVNNFAYTPIYPNFTGSKSTAQKGSENKNEQLKAKSFVLPGLVLATAGFLTSGVFVQKAYDTLNRSPKVKSEQVQFDNKKDAIEYAKQKITSRLNSEYPKEYLVYIGEDNDILGEYIGDSQSVYGNLLFYDMLKTELLNYKYTTLHGHPDHDGYSTPLSLNDWEILNKNDAVSEMIAFNKNGEMSALRKKDDYKQLDYYTADSIGVEYCNNLIEKSKITMPDKWEQVGKKVADEEFGTEYTYTEDQLITEYQLTLDGMKTVHNFWKENAPKLGLEYETNYSYLK